MSIQLNTAQKFYGDQVKDLLRELGKRGIGGPRIQYCPKCDYPFPAHLLGNGEEIECPNCGFKAFGG